MTTTSAGSTATPYCVAVMAGDRLAQRRDAERVGIADAVFGERPSRRLPHRRRGLCAGLADFEMDDAPARRFRLVGGAHHVHRDERRNEPAT